MMLKCAPEFIYGIFGRVYIQRAFCRHIPHAEWVQAFGWKFPSDTRLEKSAYNVQMNY